MKIRPVLGLVDAGRADVIGQDWDSGRISDAAAAREWEMIGDETGAQEQVRESASVPFPRKPRSGQ